MIVNYRKKGWEIVSHYTHGLLAGKLAMNLKEKHRIQYWTDTLTAIIEHDDHLLNFAEQDYLTKEGTPLDFTMSSGSNSETLEHAKRVYNHSLQKSQFVALLVGRHLEFLYQDMAQNHSPMKSFLKEINNKRAKQRKLYNLKKNDEDFLYDMLLFCDRCSLILAQGKIPDVGRKLEINKTINGKTYFISEKDEGLVHVEPWPFESSKFVVEFEYRTLNQPVFSSNNDLEKALEDAEIYLRSYTFSK